MTQERKVLASFKRVLQEDYITCQYLDMDQLDVPILLHISQDISGIRNFSVEVLQQLL